jgi:hypothetical protein
MNPFRAYFLSTDFWDVWSIAANGYCDALERQDDSPAIRAGLALEARDFADAATFLVALAVALAPVALRSELAADAERERVALMLAELAGERPSVRAYGRALEALEDGAEWWHEGRRLVAQRVRGSRHVIDAAGGCSCEAASWGRRCWAVALDEALGRLERRRLAA